MDGMMLKSTLCGLLGCRYPVLQAGMGGVARADLVGAVTRAGGYGFLGMVRESPELIRREIEAVRDGTDRPFGVNLIPAATDARLLDAELAACFDAGVQSICLFWDVYPDVIKRAKDHGCLVFHQVGTVADARRAEQAGTDVIIAQGEEAGGHVHGTTSSLVLVPQVVQAVSVPVVASGGFASGRSLVAAMALGAAGIHCGTAFLATEESFAHAYHKERVVGARSEDTLRTDLFAINWPVGASVRVIGNSLTAKAGATRFGHDPYLRKREPIALEDDRPIYRYSTDSPLRNMRGELEQLALFAGQVAGEIDDIPTAAVRIERIMAEAAATIAALSGRLEEVE
ncbi:MAG: nitronate monooxygenase [Rhodospirillales bacterium]